MSGQSVPTTGDDQPARPEWLTMDDPRAFDTSAKMAQGALFPQPSKVPGEVPLFGTLFGEELGD